MKYSLDPIGKFLYTVDSNNNFHSYDNKPAIIYLDTYMCIWMVNGTIDDNKIIVKHSTMALVNSYIKNPTSTTVIPTTSYIHETLSTSSMSPKSNYHSTSYNDSYGYTTNKSKLLSSAINQNNSYLKNKNYGGFKTAIKSQSNSLDKVTNEEDYITDEYTELDKKVTSVNKGTKKMEKSSAGMYYYEECKNSKNTYHECSDYCLKKIYDTTLDTTLI